MAAGGVYQAEPGATDINDIDGLIAWLRSGITTLPPDVAGIEIERWRQRLAGSGRPELQTIADRLASLRAALTEDPVNATTVGDLLVALGADVAALAAVEATPGISEQLDELAFTLESEGVALTGRATDADRAAAVRRPIRDVNSVAPVDVNPSLRGV